MSAQAIPTGSGRGNGPCSARPTSEAISHLTKGLEMLQALPDITARAQQRELDLQIALGQAFTATEGQAAPE